MALPKEQEDLVLEIAALCQDPKDKEALARLLTDVQPLREGFLRQSDYSRRMNEIKAKTTELETARTDAAKAQREYEGLHAANKKWRDENLPKLDAANEQVTELQAQLRKAVEEGGSEMTEAQIQGIVDAKLKDLGGSAQSPEAIRKLIDDTIKTVREEERTGFLQETMPTFTGLAWELSRIDRRFEKEFGTELDHAEFSNFYKTAGEPDVTKAFEKYLGPKRDAKKQADELAAKTKEADDLKKQLEGGATTHTDLPGSGAAPGAPMGVVQQRLAKVAESPTNVGGGVAAAVDEYRKAHTGA